MQHKINKWNAWLHRNLFWVVLCFGFWISFLVGLVSYGIWLGDSQRTEIKESTETLSIDQKKAVNEAIELREIMKKR